MKKLLFFLPLILICGGCEDCNVFNSATMNYTIQSFELKKTDDTYLIVLNGTIRDTKTNLILISQENYRVISYHEFLTTQELPYSIFITPNSFYTVERGTAGKDKTLIRILP